MSANRGGGGGKGKNGNSNSAAANGVGVGGSGSVSSIPAKEKKMVQSLKEVVNCPESEIYAMLKECNMNPDEAVERLLSQDQFHEVKSKREKKKEPKDVPDSRTRGASNRGGKGGVDWYAGHGVMGQSISSESSVLRGKPAYKKENGTTAFAPAFPPSGSTGNTVIQRPPPSSHPLTGQTAYSGEKHEGILSSHPSSGFQPAWSGVPGQKSMADIVKMGRPYGNRNASQHAVNQHVNPSSGPHDLLSHEDYPAMVPDVHPTSEVAVDQHAPLDDDWPLDEHPPAPSLPSIHEPSVDSGVYVDQPNTYYETLNHQLHSHSDDAQYTVNDELNINYNIQSNLIGGEAGANVREDSTSVFDNDLYNNVSSYQVHQHAYDPQEVEDVGISVASVSTNLQQLSLVDDDEDSPSETGSPAVKIPEHLQVQSANCSHLSFGSFGSGFSGPFKGPFAASGPSKTALEEAPAEAEAPSVRNSDTRNPEYYGDEHLLTTSDGNIAQLTVNAENYDLSSPSQPDELKQEAPEVVRDQYAFPSSTPNYTFGDDQQLNQSHAHSQTSPQMQNLPPLSNVAYPNSLQSGLLASNIQSVRESELPYSAFPTSQSMPTKYSSGMSSITGPNISLTEALRSSNFSSAQPSQTGSGALGGAALQQQQQHLAALHPYSQPSLPLGHFTNMVGIPFLPQNYYMPSAFQQSFAGTNSYHQALAALAPQYKNSLPGGSLAQSAAVASAYGAFGSSSPGNFPLNQPTGATGTTMGYDDILSSQYKDVNHTLSLQQGESSPLWVQSGSRTMSAVPASTYYSFQGQNQPPAGFRQSQQLTQHYGNLGYQNLYHSQGSGLSLEHQQQLAREGSSLGGGAGSQGQSKQSQQMWPNY